LCEYGKKPLEKKTENGGETTKMKVNYKKSLKFVTLIATALLISTVSAEVYNYLFQNATIGVEGLDLAWSTTGAADATTAGTSIAGSTCTLASLEGPAGGTKNYSDPVRLVATADTTFNLRISSISGDTGDMTSIVVRLYNVNTTSLVDTLTVWDGAQGSDLTDLSITTDHQWSVQWEISWASGASGTVSVQLKVEIPVT
jgi:hypothetical protein